MRALALFFFATTGRRRSGELPQVRGKDFSHGLRKRDSDFRLDDWKGKWISSSLPARSNTSLLRENAQNSFPFEHGHKAYKKDIVNYRQAGEK